MKSLRHDALLVGATKWVLELSAQFFLILRGATQDNALFVLDSVPIKFVAYFKLVLGLFEKAEQPNFLAEGLDLSLGCLVVGKEVAKAFCFVSFIPPTWYRAQW
eukprot:1157981-Pelagomonas_calceolata.AAC.3